jgi:hypothetical protein
MTLKLECINRKAVFPDHRPPRIDESVDLYLSAVLTGQPSLAAAVGAE